jgi:hypothetical protein
LARGIKKSTWGKWFGKKKPSNKKEWYDGKVEKSVWDECKTKRSACRTSKVKKCLADSCWPGDFCETITRKKTQWWRGNKHSKPIVSYRCKRCPANTFTNRRNDESECMKCPYDEPTTNGKRGRSKCQKCPKGTTFMFGKCRTSCKTGQGYGTVAKLTNQCVPCKAYNRKRISFYSEGQQCKQCARGMVSNKLGTGCESKEKQKVLSALENIEAINQFMNKQKEKQNELVLKTNRLWQSHDIREHHAKMMEERQSKDNNGETNACKIERSKGIHIFPAILVSEEIEKVDDTTCIDTNRAELLKSFCSFTTDLDTLFDIQKIKKTASSFWPNICCKERNHKELKVCQDPTGKIKRTEIIPFALSQGGEYNHQNLYTEVSDALKEHGYLHEGMVDLINALSKVNKNIKQQEALKQINDIFGDIDMCGPRIFDVPGKIDETKMCELFMPYKHIMSNFYNLISSFYFKKVNPQHAAKKTSFLEVMETSFRNRQTKTNAKFYNSKAIAGILQSKANRKPIKEKEGTCKALHDGFIDEKKKASLCQGYKHLDLSDDSIYNIAVHYLEKDLSYSNEDMFNLKHLLRYEVVDKNCPTKLFEAKDISIQYASMDHLNPGKEWVAVVKLDSTSKNGYLKGELPHCKNGKGLIGTEVNVNAYIDNEQCCARDVDVKECKSNACKLIPLKDTKKKPFSKGIKLYGTSYKIQEIDGLRRRLLHTKNANSC